MFLILEATLESGLGSVDKHSVTTAVDQMFISHGKYKIYSDQEHYIISKYRVNMDLGNLNPNYQT